ncbi:MAG: VIT1/CCC1 transporter family protein [Patescibacteria group bacterium]|nr:VIT1/CCC1 transporter family protein [Patescibacteria group bacterium]
MAEEISYPHPEHHSNLSGFVRNVIIGMADGLTVPFAIAAGLASAGAATSTIVIAAVLAEIAAGSISMGLGGFLATKTEHDHYFAERAREEWEVENKPADEEQEVVDALRKYGLSREESASVAASIKTRKKDWVDFMMRFELGLEEPDDREALWSAVTIGGSYIVGGLIPLTPYLLIHSVYTAFFTSIGVTLLALIIFGYLRGYFVGNRPIRSMIQTVLVGSIAAFAAFILAKLAS